MGATGLPAWQSSQPGQVGNQAALTVESVPGSRLVTLLLASYWQSMTYSGMGMAIGGFLSLSSRCIQHRLAPDLRILRPAMDKLMLYRFFSRLSLRKSGGSRCGMGRDETDTKPPIAMPIPL